MTLTEYRNYLITERNNYVTWLQDKSYTHGNDSSVNPQSNAAMVISNINQTVWLMDVQIDLVGILISFDQEMTSMANVINTLNENMNTISSNFSGQLDRTSEQLSRNLQSGLQSLTRRIQQVGTRVEATIRRDVL